MTIQLRDPQTAKKTHIGVLLTNGTRGKIGKGMKKAIVRKIENGADPRSFGIAVETLQGWMPNRRFLAPNAKAKVERKATEAALNLKAMEGQERADEVRRLKSLTPKLSQKALAEMFGCGKSTIGDILTGKTYVK